MKRVVSAVGLVLILASCNALAEQPGEFSTAKAGHGDMILPPSDGQSRTQNSNTVSDKSECLGSPYYHGVR